MAQHAYDRCAQCGQVDDHPKWHTSLPTPGWQEGEPVPTQTFHHDCAPAWLLDQHPADHVVHQIVAAARDGKHGDELRQHIVALHSQED